MYSPVLGKIRLFPRALNADRIESRLRTNSRLSIVIRIQWINFLPPPPPSPPLVKRGQGGGSSSEVAACTSCFTRYTAVRCRSTRVNFPFAVVSAVSQNLLLSLFIFPSLGTWTTPRWTLYRIYMYIYTSTSTETRYSRVLFFVLALPRGIEINH